MKSEINLFRMAAHIKRPEIKSAQQSRAARAIHKRGFSMASNQQLRTSYDQPERTKTQSSLVKRKSSLDENSINDMMQEVVFITDQLAPPEV